jgi:hypothetical protein
MRREHPSQKILFAGILSIAVGACGSSSSGGSHTGGTTGSGGAPSGGGGAGSGGVTSTGGGASGGMGGNGGSTAQALTGGTTGNGGTSAAGGSKGTGGAGTGGSGTVGSGGRSTLATGGATGGGNTGGMTGATEDAGTAGRTETGGNTTGGTAGGDARGTDGAAGGSTGTGTCTASKAAGSNASGSGPHKVTVETNSDPGITEGTIYRPTDLGGAEKYPIFAWGEGGCSENGNSNSAAMGEIASHGYFVIADGTPGGSASRSQTSDTAGMGKPLLAYITWAIAENAKPCSAYYQSLDTTKIATNGFSCGGLMAEGTAGDPRITTWGLNSSGLFAADQAFYKTIHTPVLIVLGGSGDIAYTNGERDYDNISALGIPIMLFSKALGHGGDLFTSRGGDFTKIDVAWLNWWLKGDEGATGKGVLVGSGCTYCTDSAWEVKSKNLP